MPLCLFLFAGPPTLTLARPPTRVWVVVRTVVAPLLSVVESGVGGFVRVVVCLWCCACPVVVCVTRRIYRRGFTEFISGVISALGYLTRWGNSKFYLRLRSLPEVSPKLPFGLILDSTAVYLVTDCC